MNFKSINNHKQSGMSLIETLMTVALSGLFLILLLAFQNGIDSSQSILIESTQSHNEANLALQTMIREIRDARPADTGSYPLVLANDQEIIFYSNIDSDSDIERIRYFLDDRQLKKGIIQPQGSPPTYTPTDEQISLVINYINNQSTPIFSYYNGNWPNDTTNNPLGTPSRLTDTKLIHINVIINPTVTRPEAEYKLESSVQIRNLKTNL